MGLCAVAAICRSGRCHLARASRVAARANLSSARGGGSSKVVKIYLYTNQASRLSSTAKGISHARDDGIDTFT
eukprot:2194410-Pleurochrysis_carterae.AAC.1